MKKTVFRILLAVCVFLSVSAIAVSGKTEIAFTATATSAFTDGGYYALGSGFALSDAGNGALKIVGAGRETAVSGRSPTRLSMPIRTLCMRFRREARSIR